MPSNDSSVLETSLLQVQNGRVEIIYYEPEHCFLATLLEEAGTDELEGTMHIIVRASGQTVVEAVLQLESACQKLLGGKQ